MLCLWSQRFDRLIAGKTYQVDDFPNFVDLNININST